MVQFVKIMAVIASYIIYVISWVEWPCIKSYIFKLSFIPLND